MAVFGCFLALIIIEAVILLILSVKKYEYKCKKCGTVFDPRVKEKLFGINSGEIKKASIARTANQGSGANR